MESSLGNFEALLAICAPLAQALCVLTGLGLMLFCWFPSTAGLRGYSLKLLAAGFGTLLYGLFIQEMVNMVEGAGSDAILSIIIAPVIVLLGFIAATCITFVPCIIAFNERKEHRFFVLVLNLLCLIPVFWLIAFFWACTGPGKSEAPPPIPPPEQPAASAEPAVNAEPGAIGEPPANVEPAANTEPAANAELAAIGEPPASVEPAANTEPPAISAADELPSSSSTASNEPQESELAPPADNTPDESDKGR